MTENAHHGEQSIRKRLKRSGFKLGDFGWDLRKQDFFPGLDIVRKHKQQDVCVWGWPSLEAGPF